MTEPAVCDLVVPCRDEALALPTVLAQVPARFCVVVVDNGSCDGTAEVAGRLGAQVVRAPVAGYGAAVDAGVRAARAPYVAVMDGDAAGPQPSQPGTASGSFAPPPPNRTIALSQASNDIESAQRELDVAGGDCRNACRALGSMDRAAGRLCGLAQSSDEQRRCGDAKTRVYSARAKVKNTCGSCPDVSVDRDAPIPSR